MLSFDPAPAVQTSPLPSSHCLVPFFLANILRFGKMTSFGAVQHEPNAEKMLLKFSSCFLYWSRPFALIVS